MSYAILDVETTTKNKGNPFTKGNKLCLVGIKDAEGTHIYDIEYSDAPYGEKLDDIRRRLQAVDCVVGFNVKFDLHWILNYAPDCSISNVFDCQLAEFLISCQSKPYPSLDEACLSRGLGGKLSSAAEYWDSGVDTPSIPYDVLSEYLTTDLVITEQLYLAQVKELGDKTKLHKLQCKDLLVLMQMERNGVMYDFGKALELGTKAQTRLKEIDEELCRLSGIRSINWNSSDHVSCVLFGGIIQERYREQYTRTLKDGTIKERERWSERPIQCSRLANPIKRFEGSATRDMDDGELARENAQRDATGKRQLQRIYSVAEPILKQIVPRSRRGQAIITLLLERARLEKLDSTYYTGLYEKIQEKEWEKDTIHGSFNQCVVVTGRLSSSEPNLQNFAGDIKELFYSRYK